MIPGGCKNIYLYSIYNEILRHFFMEPYVPEYYAYLCLIQEQRVVSESSIQSKQGNNIKCKCSIKSHSKIENKEKYTNEQNTWIDTDNDTWQKEP